KVNGNNLDDGDKKESGPRRVTRALVKTKNQSKVNHHVGKLVWGSFGEWWPALIVDAKHVGMAPAPSKLWVFWIGESQISLLREGTQIQPFSRCLEERLSLIGKPSRKNVRVHAINTTIKMLHQRYNGNLTEPYYFWIRRNIDMETLDDLSFYPYPEDIQAKLDELRERNEKATKKCILSRRSSPEVPPTKKQKVEKNKDTTTSWKQIDDERLDLQNQQPGVIAWAKIPGHCWWPAMIIDYRDCCLKEPRFGCQWIMWYGDYQVSEVRHLDILKFHKGIEKMCKYIKNTSRQPYLEGVLQASKDYCSRLGCNTDNWTLDNVFEYFSNNIHIPNNQLQVSDSNKVYDKYSDMMIKKINEFKFKSDVDAERKRDIKASDDFRRAMSGECDIEKLCLKCLTIPKGKKEEHPFFTGALCKECSYEFKQCMFVYGNDGKCFYCTVCASTGTLLICDSEGCPRVYCTACLKILICPESYDEMLKEDPWEYDFRRAMSGECDIEKLCLKCLTIPKGKKEEHPFFTGALCKECSYEFKQCMFVYGNDGKCFYCTVCASTGTLLICDSEGCPRVYCTACLKILICPESYDKMLKEDPWECFLCRDETKQPADMIFRTRLNWKEKFPNMFRTTPNLTSDVDVESNKKQNEAVRVLSLFDGLSAGFLVLQKLGLEVDVYYASEIDENALTISSSHFGDRITYLGDVRDITKEKIQKIAPIDLLIGGSPCNDLSLVNPARLGLHDPKGTGILFFEYIRIKKLLEKANKGRHMFWLFENVASMPTEYILEINEYLGRKPDVIDSAYFSPQHRLRLYWHNLPFNPYLQLSQSVEVYIAVSDKRLSNPFESRCDDSAMGSPVRRWKVLVDLVVSQSGIKLLEDNNCEVTTLENYNADVYRQKILAALRGQGFDVVFLAPCSSSHVKVDKEFLDAAGGDPFSR
ncbi:DNA (Cytosine-5)-methyltransferase 3B, partial [Temnothorax longispinosus]